MRCATSRPEAKRLGVSKYFTGLACVAGHVAEKYTIGGSCVVCASLRAASPDKKRYDRAYAEANREHIAKRSGEYRRRTLSERLRKIKEWSEKNRDRVRATKQAYKSRRRTVERAGIGGPELRAWEAGQTKTCYWCGMDCVKNYHIDHYEPLSRGGKHEVDNLVISCPKCNRTKSAKDPYQFAQSLGRLF
jgi:5-methylcytosine-specific restriction endonuclease McrA